MPRDCQWFTGQLPKGPEYRPMPTIIESTMGSKEEVVGREVIHKTALKQLRCPPQRTTLESVNVSLGDIFVVTCLPWRHVQVAKCLQERHFLACGPSLLLV
jgi:hypothetical protein